MSEMHEATPVSQPFPHFERLVDSREAAALLQIHPKTLQRLARKGEIRAMRIGKLWRFRTSDLDAWVHLRLKLASYQKRGQNPLHHSRRRGPCSPSREFSFALHQIQQAIEPHLSLQQTLYSWNQIAQALAERSRNRLLQLAKWHPS